MNALEFSRMLKAELNREAEKITTANGSGGARDFAHYKEMAGKAKGLLAAIAIIDKTFKVALEDNMREG